MNWLVTMFSKSTTSSTLPKQEEPLNPDEEALWRLAAEQILKGSSILPLWPAITKASSGGSGRAWYRSNLEGILGLEDFDWPWYDEWMRIFQEKGEYPDTTFRYEFDSPSTPDAPPYKEKGDVLKGMTIAELRNLAKTHAIKLAGKTKKADLCESMIDKISWEDVAEWAAKKNVEHEQKIRIARIRAKQNLLSHTLFFRFHNLYRHWQIADLLREAAWCKRRPYLEHEGANLSLVRKFTKDWKFDPHNRENLPPFFPGDCTQIETRRV